jgi:hypothetical protein|tara:strand:- start:164 stop:298 length:135 start_codon:yes stop_codon:yes gene_type:complete
MINIITTIIKGIFNLVGGLATLIVCAYVLLIFMTAIFTGKLILY